MKTKIYLENVRRRLQESLQEMTDLEAKIKLYIENILPDIRREFSDPRLILDNIVTKLQIYARDEGLDAQEVYQAFENLVKNNSIEGLDCVDDIEYAEALLNDKDKMILERAIKAKFQKLLNDTKGLDETQIKKLQKLIDECVTSTGGYTEDNADTVFENVANKLAENNIDISQAKYAANDYLESKKTSSKTTLDELIQNDYHKLASYYVS